MKNWKTTLSGFILGSYPIIDALIKAYEAGYFTDKTGSSLWIGISFIVIGALSKDHDVTGTNKFIGGSKPPVTKDEK